MSFLEMQVLPQALPTVQILQHTNALAMAIDDVPNPKDARAGFSIKGVLWMEAIEVAWESPVIGASDCADIASAVMARAAVIIRNISHLLELARRQNPSEASSVHRTCSKVRDLGHNSLRLALTAKLLPVLGCSTGQHFIDHASS
jgi:hypothetical protein